jgi:hypothetical protein
MAVFDPRDPAGDLALMAGDGNVNVPSRMM